MQNIREVGFLELLDTRGKPVFLEGIWRDRVTVMTLTRHFGCLFCLEQVDALCSLQPELASMGVQLMIVGNGNPAHARDFMRRFDLSSGVYTDPARVLYRRLGLAHGIGSTLNWTSSKNIRRASAKGFRQEAVQGDRWQQGGTFVLGPDGAIAYDYRSRVAGDHAPVEQVLRAARRVSETTPDLTAMG